ncbi:hypothetical protein BGX27_010311 [Mortierella sp. AM989]|nr:hypothetical protein BGX27_010311 [Mortierella sp. AM989]
MSSRIKPVAMLPRALNSHIHFSKITVTTLHSRACAVSNAVYTGSHSPVARSFSSMASHAREALPQRVLMPFTSGVGRYVRFSSSNAATAAPTADHSTPTALKIHNPQYDESGIELTVDITEKAAKQLKHIATRDQNPMQGLRITVDSGGCHGYQYLMDLTDTINDDDVIFEKDGARVIIDTITLPMISGSRIDFIEELIGSAFKVLANPHAAHSCGDYGGISPESLIGRASRVLSESTSIKPTDRPAYVTAPSVSAKEMVQAIESSRQEAATKSILGSSSIPSVPETATSNDPFGKNADPFANHLGAAIEASLRSTQGHRDRLSEHEVGSVQLPDVQAKYLVGPARWETVRAKDVHIKNVTPRNRPKVASLEHGLDRVLFNPGVHWLQDPRSSVYNFDPYLRSICQPENFDYDALPAYKTSSLDPSLLKITKTFRGKYMGSTSSMTSILSQFYYLISGWKPLKTNHLSEAFMSQPRGFTRFNRAPTTIQLVYKGHGIYAIDADKTFDSSTVLMQLGKSMEKMLTSTQNEFARFTKGNSWQVTKKERRQPEAFNYIAVDKFLLRSQLDCEDPRLPGKTFDLKTRAAVAIRLDVHNYELNQGYQLRKTHGYLESFEREYYDMMRSAFLKYSLQVRIGQMDGIFVAFHNTARIFGFQYISLDEMDSRLFGSTVMGDESFKNQLRLLDRTLDEITAKYPEQDLKITVDTDETVQSMNVWVETMPQGAASSTRGRDIPVVFDENGAPEMQPGAELSLWQIVCYSNLNRIPTVGPFELSERATDDWELRYKIAELKKPHMMNEYRRVMAIQAKIMSDDQERQATLAAAATVSESASQNQESRREARATSRRDHLRSMLRRISEQGRAKQEDEERRQADKEFLVWEPKGYTKDIDPLNSSSVVSKDSVLLTSKPINPSANKPIPARSHTHKPTVNTAEELTTALISARMIRRLKGSASKTALPNEIALSDKIRDVAIEAQSQPIIPTTYYRRATDDLAIKLAFDDLSLIRKSMSGPLTDSKEIQRLQSLKPTHNWLISTLTPFDHIRLTMMEIPARLVEYLRLNRNQLDWISEKMGQPEISRPADVTDEALRRKLHKATIQFRYKLHLDYFHNWIHKVIAMRDDANPFTTLEEFVKIDDEEALVRAANGVHIGRKMVRRMMHLQSMRKTDAIKKSILCQIYYSEKCYTDNELKELGFFPRIFDPAVIESTRDIMKEAIGKNEQDDRFKTSTSIEKDALSPWMY